MSIIAKLGGYKIMISNQEGGLNENYLMLLPNGDLSVAKPWIVLIKMGNMFGYADYFHVYLAEIHATLVNK